VLSSLQNAVLPRLETVRFRPLRLLPALVFLCFVFLSPALPAGSHSLDDAVGQLAERIATIPNLHGPLRLEIHADANLASDPGWQDTLRQELEKRHLTIAEEPSAILLRVGAVETPTQIVLTASVRVGDRDEVRIVAVTRAAFTAPAPAAAPVHITRQLIYESSDRILDASSLSAAEGGLAVLLYRNADLVALRLDSSGAVKQTVSLAAAAFHATRDPRGEISAKSATVEVLLPGKSCEFNWTAGEEPRCRARKTEWRAPTVLAPPCDASDWKLEARGDDWASADLLQIAPDAAARTGSAALFNEFPGLILSINNERDSVSALIVARNLRTGNYEVYKITLVCGN
jgi:hypothetical protein